MPLIINLPRKKFKRKYDAERTSDDHKYVYNTNRWRELRILFLKDNPNCSVCSTEDDPVLAIDVHHKIPISAGKTKSEKQIIGFDFNNLVALCEKCHHDTHRYL